MVEDKESYLARIMELHLEMCELECDRDGLEDTCKLTCTEPLNLSKRTLDNLRQEIKKLWKAKSLDKRINLDRIKQLLENE